ncbi:MAG: antibiotic biosynthesis monooxygenase [Dehalococcoidia bacterium]
MYGTVGHMRVQPGRVDEFLELNRKQYRVEAFISGSIVDFVFRLDAEPEHVIVVVVFDSRESYHANAQSPGQDQRYREVRELLSEDPLWLDGEVEPLLQQAGGDLARARYGTVAQARHMPGKWAEIEELVRIDEQSRNVRGAIGDWVFRLDRDPNEVVIVTVFESRELYRLNAADPEQNRSYQRLRALLADDPVWHDGEVILRLRFEEVVSHVSDVRRPAP